MATEKRLIDANALKIHRMHNIRTNHPLDVVYRKDIDNAPDVDAVEVVHGLWIDEYPHVRCSVCNAEWLNCRTDNDPKEFYYCPNCGAKMDGERKDNECTG